MYVVEINQLKRGKYRGAGVKVNGEADGDAQRELHAQHRCQEVQQTTETVDICAGCDSVIL